MSKNKISLAVIALVVIGLTIYAFNLSSSYNAEFEPNKDFKIEDTAAIDKIVIKDANNREVVLTKEDKVWYLNESYKARQDAIETILETLKRLEVKRELMYGNVAPVIKMISASHVRVEVYMGSSTPEKTYFVGGTAQEDKEGTYMLLETKADGRSSKPYITYVRGEHAGLQTRFFVDEIEWRHSGIFNYDVTQISKVSVENHEDSTQSFYITRNESEYKLSDYKGIEQNVNLSTVQSYVKHFKKIHYQNIERGFDEAAVDSIAALPLHFTISVTNKKGRTNKIEIHKYPLPNGSEDIHGTPMKYSGDVMYGQINDRKEIVLIQYFVFGKLLMEKDYFLKNQVDKLI